MGRKWCSRLPMTKLIHSRLLGSVTEAGCRREPSNHAHSTLQTSPMSVKHTPEFGLQYDPVCRYRAITRFSPASPRATKVNMPSVTLISSGDPPDRVRRTHVSTWTVIEVRPMRSVRQ